MLWVDFLILFSVQEVVLSGSSPGGELGRVLLGNGKLAQVRAQMALPLCLWRPCLCASVSPGRTCVHSGGQRRFFLLELGMVRRREILCE